MMRALSPRAGCLLLLGVFAACGDDRQLVVVVSSDLELPRELANVDVSLRDEAGNELAAHSFQVAGPGGVGVPFSFGLAPREAGPLMLVVSARGPSLPADFPPVVRLIEAVPPGRSGLAVHLSRGCAGSACAGGETCLDGVCGARLAASDELVALEEGAQELELVCSAGPTRCSSDGLSLRTCRALGQAPAPVACPLDTRCDEASDRCVAADAERRRVEVELVGGDGFGRVVSSPSGIRCGLGDSACQADFPRGSSVTLTAEPGPGGRFIGWAGDCSGAADCVLELGEHREVQASFEAQAPDQMDLRLQLVGGGLGEIRFALPSGQPPCDSDCTRSFPRGTAIQLEVEPAASSRFEGWMGGCAGFGSCLPDTTQSSVSVQARIVLNTHPVTLTFSGEGEAQLLLEEVEVCSTQSDPCTVALPADRDAELRAVAADDTRILGFSGLCQSTRPECRFRPSGPGTVTVALERAPTRPNPFDLDGDGVSDLIVGAPGMSVGNQELNAGRLYFLAGPVGGSPVNAGGQPFLGGAAAEQAGGVFAFPGDLNGDGVADLVVGLPAANQGVGVVYVVPGSTSFAASSALGVAAAYKLEGSNLNGRFGAAVIGLPDQNGDGRPDFAVGAPGARQVGVYSISPNDAEPVLLSTLGGGGLDLDFGASLQFAGDVDGDGVGDLAIAAPSATANGVLFAGAVHLFRGPFAQGSFGPSQAWIRFVGGGTDQRLGFRMAGGVNFAGGPAPDLALSYGGSGNVPRRVAVYANLPALGGSTDVLIDQASHDLFGGPLSSRNFAASLLALENVLAAGSGALFVGDPEHEGAGKGAVHAFQFASGAPSAATLFGGDCVNQGCTDNRFGATLGRAGDVDGDGAPELLVGALWGGGQAGRMGRGRVALFPSGRLRAGQLAPTFSLVGEDVEEGRCVGTGLPFGAP